MRAGEGEHWDLGSRWSTRLGLQGEVTNLTVVRSSTKQRCRASAAAFLEGMFNTTGEEGPRVEEDNQLLRFYDNCPKYEQEVEESYKPERDKFEASPAFQDLVARVGGKTGLNLQQQQVDLMWKICRYFLQLMLHVCSLSRFETAWYPGTLAPWCSVFSILDFRVLEFREDLKYYYQ